MPDSMLVSWMKKLLGNQSRRSRRARAEAPRRRASASLRPMIESLEDRVAPANWLVTLSTPDVATTVGTLRYAYTQAAAGDTISFASNLNGATITLASTLTIGKNLTIVGPGASNLTIAGTNASFGAAGIISVSAGEIVSISGLTFTNGLATQGSGIKNAGTLSLSNDTIANNGAASNTTNHYGGGIYNTGTLTTNGCTISGNFTYTDGGGIYNTGTMTLSNTTIQGNGCYTYGGGIDNAGTMTLSNDTITGNTGWNGTASYGEYGGGFYSSTATTQMVNTIVASNTATTTGADIDATVAAATNCLIATTTGYTLTTSTNNQLGVAAGLGALAFNGGPTKTMALTTGSAAIAHGGAVTTVPAAGILATGNTITLTSGAFFGNVATGLSTVIIINTEQMLVTGVAGNVLTVVRGYNNTTAAAHASGAGVYFSYDERGYAITPTTLATPDIGAYQTTGTAPSTPTVTSISPVTGPLAGGTTVTITGTNLTNATRVNFGGIAGTIVSDSGTVIVVTSPAEPASTVDVTVTTVGWDTTATTPPDLFTFTASTTASYGDYLNSGSLIIAREILGNNDNLNMAIVGANYVFTDTGGLLFDAAAGSGAASITGAGTSTITIPTSAITGSIEVALGNGTNLFQITGTSAAAAPLLAWAGLTAGDQIKFTGATSDSGAVTLVGTSITETGTGALTATGILTTTSVTGTTLNVNANPVAAFNATNTGVGAVALTGGTVAPLAVTGLSDITAGGPVSVTNTGGVNVAGPVTVGTNALTLSGTAPLTPSVIVLPGTTAATTTITMASTAGLSVGMLVVGTGIPVNAYVTAIVPNTSITISVAATASGAVSLSFAWIATTLTGTTNATTTITMASTAGLATGMWVTGTGIPANATITAIVANTSITISAAATASGATTLSFGWNGTTASTATITMANTSGLAGGMLVTGTGIPAGTTIVNIVANTSITISTPATASGVTPLSFSWPVSVSEPANIVLAATTAATTTIVMNSTAPLAVGMVVSGTGIASNTYITGINPNASITISAAATASATTWLSFAWSANTLTGTTNATTTITMPSTTGLVTGMFVTGAGIPANTTITTITANTSIVISAAATASGLTTLTFTRSGTTNATNTITTAATAGLAVGMLVTGTGIPAGSTIVSIVANTSITISAAATTSAVTPLTVTWPFAAGALTTTSVAGTTLNIATNSVTGFSATNTGIGTVNLLDSTPTLTVGAISDSTAGGPVTVNNTGGAIILTGAISAGTNALNLTTLATAPLTQTAGAVATGGLLTISAGSIGTAVQSVVVGSTTLAANTVAGPNGNQYLAATGTTGLATASALNAGTGSITLTGGTFKNLIANGIPATEPLTVTSPGAFDLGGFAQTTTVLSGTGTVTDSGAAATLTLNAATTFAGNITGANLALSIPGAITVTFSGANTYGGATTLPQGTLKGGASNAFSPNSAVTLGAAGTVGTLDLAGFNESVGGLAVGVGATAASQLVGNSSTTTPAVLTVASGTSTFAGTIQNALGAGTQTTGLTVSGGSLTLTGADTYTGPTSVTGGTLLVNTPLSTPVAVSGTGTLGGTASVGAITGTGGTVNPGSPASSVGILTAPSLNLSGGGNLTLEIAAVTTPGVGFDQLNLGSGTLTLGGTSTLTLDTAGLATTGTITTAVIAGSIVGNFSAVNVINAAGYAATESIAGNVMTITIYVQVATSISTTSGSGQSGTVATAFASSLVATVKDQNNYPMAGVTVTFTAPASGASAKFSNSTNTITGATNSQGQLVEVTTAGTVTGSYTVSAVATGIATPTTFSLTNTAGAAATIVVASGSPQSTIVNTAFTPLLVTVTDAYGNLVPNASVTFTAPASALTATGVFSNSTNTITGTTNASGQLSETFTANTHTGVYTVTAAAAGVATPANFSLTNNPGAGTQLIVTTQPSATATAGVNFAVQPVVIEEDQYGNLVTTDSTHTVTAARGTQGTASLLGGPLTVTLASGIATFSGLVYDKAETMNLVFTTNAGGFSAPSSNVVVSPNITATVGFFQQPVNSSAGVAINPAVKAAIEDAYGNVEPSDNGSTLSISVASGPAGASFTSGSTLVAVDSAGIATFSNLVLTAAGAYTLKASDVLLGYNSTPSSSFTVTANTTATQLVLGVQPTGTTAGAALSPQVTASLEDAYGNVETGDNASTVSIAVASGPGAFASGSTTSVTVSGGVATFTTLKLNTVGTYTLSASDAAPALTSAASNSFVITPNTAAQLVFGQQPSNAIAGSAISPAVTVKIEDAYGNVETADNASILSMAALTGPGALSGSSTASVTVNAGVATFGNLVLNTAGSYTLQASDASPALTSSASSSFLVSPSSAAKVVFGQQPTNVTAGVALSPVVMAKLEDAYGNVETADNTSSLSIAIASGPAASFAGGSTTTVIVSAGIAAFTTLKLNTAGSYTLQASDSAPAIIGPASNSFVVAPNSAAQLVFGQQPTNTVAGVSMAPAVTVKIEDTYGNVETGDNTSSLTLGVASGPSGGTVASGGTGTASAGVVTFSGLKLNTAGAYTLNASDSSPVLTSPASSSFVIAPNTATQLVFGQQPSPAASDLVISPAVTVKIEDAYGNLETADYASTVTITPASGPGAFTPTSTTSVTANGGVATFGNLALGTPGTYTLAASATGGITSPASSSFAITPNTLHLAFIQQPTNTTAGQIVSSVSVGVYDQTNTLDSADNIDQVTLAIVSGPGTFASGSVTTITVSGGIANFNSLVFDKTGTYVLSENSASATGANSNTFQITVAAPTQLAFSVEPANAVAGVANSAAVQVQILDTFGNLETGNNTDTVALTIGSGPGPFAAGSTTTAIAVGGVATFTTVTFDTAGPYTLHTNDALSLTTANSTSFVVSPAAATQLVFGQQPTNLVAGNAVSPVSTVKIEDQFGNVETGDNASSLAMSIASGPAGGVFASGSATSVTVSAGIATFTTLKLNTAGAYTFKASDASPALTSAASNGFVVSPNTATQIVFGQQPTNALAGVALAPAVTAKLEDQYGNVETANNASILSIAISSGPAGGAFAAGSTPAVTLSAGVATFTNLTFDTTGVYSLTVTDPAPALTSAASSTFLISPNSSTQLVFGQQPTGTLAGVSLSPPVTVKIEDAYGNVETGDSASTLSIAIASGPSGASFASGSTPSVTVSAGVATFTTLTFDKAGAYTLQASDASPSFTTVPSSAFTISPNTATQLVFGQQPTVTTAGIAMNPGPTVKIEDAFGNVETADNATNVTLAITSGPAGGVFAAGTAATESVSAGIATFNSLIFDTAGTYILSENTATLTGPNSSAFQITAASANHLLFSVQPSNTLAGVAISPAVQVKVYDAFGNLLIANNSDPVTLTIASGPGVFAPGSASAVSASGGVATFSSLLLDTAGAYTLRVSDGFGLPLVVSNSFVVSPAGAAQLAFGQQPTGVIAGATDSPAVTVKIEDAFGNVETGDNASSLAIAIASGPTGGVFAAGSTITVPVSAGMASFSALKLDTAGIYTLQASDASPALTSAPSNPFVVSPNTATQIVFGQQPTTALAGAALAPTVTAELEDQYGNVETGDNASSLSLAIHSGPAGGTLAAGSTPTATVNAGVATFTTLKFDTAGAYTLTASDVAPALTSAASNSFVISPNTATQVVFGQQPSSTTAGVALSPPVTAKIEDTYGNVETGDNASSLSIAIASGPAGATFASGSTTTATVSGGVATFTTLTLDTAGVFTLQAHDASPVFTSAASGTFTINPNTRTQVVFGQQPSATFAGAPISPAVTVKIEDQYGNVETADNASSVTLGVASGPTGGAFSSGATATATVSSGVASFSNLILNSAGTYTLSESAVGGLTGPNSTSFVVSPLATGIHLAFIPEPSATVAGVAISPGVTVEILDALNNIVSTDSTDQVSLTIGSGPGGFAGASTTTVTAVNGIATFNHVVLDTAGAYTLDASASGGLTGLASTAFTVSPAAATQLAFSQQPGTTAAGVAINPAVTVQVLDQYNNLVSSDNTDHVAIAVATGPGSFTGGSTTTMTVSGGIATFNNLVLDTAGSYMLGVTATGGLTGPNSSLFQVTPLAATQLLFGTQPGATVAGVAIHPSVTVRVVDAYDNLVTSDNTGQVTLAIASGPGGFTTGSTTTAFITGGLATFSNLVLDTTGSYSLTENATAGLTGPVSSSFQVSPAAASHLVFSQQPGTTTAGVAINPAVVVRVLDAFNNLVTTDNTDQVTLSIASGPVTFTGTSTPTVTVSGGIATFSNLVLDTIGTYALTEKATGGLTGPTSNGFQITPAAGAQLIFTQQPGATTAGVAINPAVTVTIYDAFNNILVNDNSDQVTLALASGPGAFTAGSTTTATVSGGVATFSNLVLDTAGNYVLSDSATGGLTGPASSTFTINPKAASQLVFSQQPTDAVAGVALNPAVTVKIEDPFGNVETGDSTSNLNLTIASGPGVFAGGSTASAIVSAGVATFPTLAFDTAGAYELLVSDAAPGLPITPSNSFVISPATATKLVFGQQPANTTAGVAVHPVVTALLEDQFGNLETSDYTSTVGLTIASGPAGGNFAGGSITSATVTSGVAIFPTLLLDTAGAYMLTANDTAASLTSAASSSFSVSPNSATQLVFGQQPTTTVAGIAIFPDVTVRVLDAYNNLVTSDNSDVITLGVASGPGSITASSTATATASGGIATFSNLALSTAGAYTLSEVAAGGLTGPNSSTIQVVATANHHLTFGVQPGATVAGVAINPAVTVHIVDQFNNLVSADNTDTVTLVVANGPGSFAGTSTVTVTAVGGIATFNNLLLDTAGSYTLAATATGGLTGVASATFTVSPATATHLAFSQQPGTTAAGAAINPAVTVDVLDAFGNLVTTDSTDHVTLAVASGPGNFAGGSTTTATASAGIATFSNLVLDSAGTYALGDSATGGLTGPASSSFQVTPLAPSQLVFGTQPGATVAGASIKPAVTVRILDSLGNLVTSDSTGQITLTIASGPAGFAGSSTTSAIASGGIATFSNLVLDTTGTYTLSESATGGLTGPTSASFQVTPAAADHLVFGQQPGTTSAGVAINPAVTVRILDAFSNLVTTDSSDQVTLGIASGPAGFTGTSTTTVTASAGIATFSNLVLDTAGTYSISEVASGPLYGLASNGFAVTPGSATHLAFGQQPGTTTAGVAINPAVTVRLLDAFNNLVASDNSDQVTLSLASGPGAFTSGSTTTAAVSGGVATFSNLVLDTAGGYSLADSATGGLTGPASSFVVVPNSASQLAFGQQPTLATAGVALTPAVTVKIEDPYGNVETADNASSLSLAISSGPTGAVFAGGSATSATVIAGVATFPLLTLDTAGVYQLTAHDAAPSLASAASNSFTIQPNTATKLVFGQQPANTTAGVALGSPVTVRIEDQFGNIETGDNASTLSLAIASGPAGSTFAAGSTTSAVVTAGVATFPTLTLDAAGAYTLSASDASPSLTSPASSSFTVSPSSATQLVFGQQPSTTAAGTAIAPGVTVRILDAFNNLVTSDNSGVVTLAIAGGPGGFTGTSTVSVTPSGGVATFSNLLLDTAGSYTLSESASGGLAGPSSNSFLVAAAAPTHLAFEVQPGNTVAGVAINPAVIVRVLDQFNNLVSSDNADQVTLAVASGPGSLSATSATTATVSGGIATFNNLVLDTAGSYTLSETATGSLSGAASSSFVVNPAAATGLVFGQQPNTTAAGSAINPAVTVRLLDQFNNLVTTDNTDQVTLAIANGPGAFAAASTTTVTVSGGVATFGNLLLDTAGSYTLNESATGGLNGLASNAFQVTPLGASHLAFGTQPGTTVAGVTINPALTVRILDPFNNLVTSDNSGQVSLTVAAGPGGFTASSTPTASVTGGIATFSNLTLDTAGLYTLSENATGGLTGAGSTTFQVTPAAADHLVFGQQPANTVAGVTLNPAVTVRVVDAFGNVVTGDNSDQVTLALVSSPANFTATSATTATVSAGIATFSNLTLDTAGTYVLSENATSGLSGLSSNSFQITPAAATHLAFGQQPGTTIAGVAINPAVTVRVLDVFNNLVTSDNSDQVTLAIASGPGTFASGSPFTATVASGVATFNNLLLDTAGSYALGASTAGGLVIPASSGFTVSPSAATQVVFGQQPTAAAAGATLTPTVTAKIEDQYGNVETADSTSSLNLAINTGPAGAALASGSTSSAIVANGVATFPTLKFDTAGAYTLAASDSSASLPSAVSSNFTINPNVAAQLVLAQQPTNTAAGIALNPAVSVQIEDQFGNVETNDSASSLSLAIASGPAGAAFAAGSTTSVLVTAGVATFPTVLLDTAGAYTLRARDASPSLTSANSQSFTVSPNSAAQLAFSQQPTTTVAGNVIQPAVTVRIVDAYNNLITTDNSDLVTLAVASGPGSFSGATTATASGGIATFSNLILDTAGSYTLNDITSGGLTGANSSSFQVVPAAADHLAFGVEPSNTVAGVAINPAVTVRILDPFNNVITSDNIDRVTLAVSGPGGFTGTSTTTATVNAGVATFGNLVLDTAGAYTFSESATDGLPGAGSSSFQVLPAAATHLVFGQQPTTTTVGVPVNPAVTVLVLDSFNNLVTTDNSDAIGIAIGSGPGSFTSGSTTTATTNGGVATFGNLVFTTQSPSDSLTASNPGLGNAISNLFNVRNPVTAITVGSSLNPSIFGQTVNLNVTVTGAGGTPGGAVTVQEGPTTLATAALNAAGMATIPLTGLAAGAQQSLLVSYAGDGLFAPSSTTLLQTVTPANTTTVLSATGSSVYGQALTFTATVAVVSPGAGQLTGGTVTFNDGTTTLGSGILNNLGQATFTTTSLNVGAHSITATYDAVPNFVSSTSSAGSQSVSIASTTTTLATTSPSNYGQQVTFTATVFTTTGIAAAGTVTFDDGTTVLGTAALNAQGVATFTTAGTQLATNAGHGHSITAIYGATSNSLGSTSAPQTQIVNPAVTQIDLASSTNGFSTIGQTVTFTAAVIPATAGAGTPTGTVSFYDNGKLLGSAPINVNGLALFAAKTLTLADHTISATYSGATNFAGSTTTFEQDVSQIATTVNLYSSLSAGSVFGQAITFSAIVSDISPVATKLTGSVRFFDNGILLGTATLNASGVATLTTAVLTGGIDHTITASYAGTANIASASTTLNQMVAPAATSVTLQAPAVAEWTTGVPIVFTAKIAAAKGLKLAGTVTFIVDGVAQTTVNLTAAGSATFNFAGFATTGAHTVSATFNPSTANLAASTSATLTRNAVDVSNVTLSTSNLNPTHGQPVTITAAVNGATATPTGQVSFYDGTRFLGTYNLDDNGIASITLTSLSIGSHSITATYLGDTNYLPKTSKPLILNGRLA